MSRSFRAAAPQRMEHIDTIADSLAPPMTTQGTYDICRQFVDEIVTVSDAEICAALALLFREAKLAVEPAGAAAPAQTKPTTVVLALNGGTLTLKASFGSVNWSIAESSSLVGRVTVSPTAGTLASGQSTTVSLRAASLLGGLLGGGLHEAAPADGGGGVGACVACTLTVNPGNITVTVVLDISVGSSSNPPSSPPPSSPPPEDARPAAVVGRLVH